MFDAGLYPIFEPESNVQFDLNASIIIPHVCSEWFGCINSNSKPSDNIVVNNTKALNSAFKTYNKVMLSGKYYVNGIVYTRDNFDCYRHRPKKTYIL